MRCSIDDIKRVARVLMDDSVLPFTFDDSVSCKNYIVLSHFVNNINLYFLMYSGMLSMVAPPYS